MITKKHKEICRYRLRIYRYEKGYTLRKLSNVLSISPSLISRIEQGTIEVSNHLYEQMMTLFNIDTSTFEESVKAFETHSDKLLRHLYYMEYGFAKEIFDTFFKPESAFENSPIFLEYYILKVAYLLMTQQDFDTIEKYVKRMIIVEEAFKGIYLELYLLMRARYATMQYNIEEAKSYFALHLNSSQSDSLKSMNLYYQGIMYGFSYKTYQKALRCFESAKSAFQDQNNFQRLMDLKLIEQRLLIYTNDYLSFEELNRETLHYGEIHLNPYIYNYSLQQKALYCIALSDYKGALELFNYFKIDTIEYVFHKVYVLFKLGYYIEAQHLMNETKIYRYDASLKAINSGYDAMIEMMNTNQTEAIIAKLKIFADQSYDSEVFPLIKIAFKLYISVLESERIYKEAYLYSHKLLEVTKMTMK